MLELLSLRFGNIRSFVTDQEIVFSGRDKLIQIDGKNLKTGGSSGAGKSTVLIVLDYLLGLNDIPSTLLQSRLTKEAMWAEGEFLVDGKPVTIARSKKHGLVITTESGTVSGNSDQAEEKLQEIIGLPIAIFKKMIHKKQKEGGFFLSLGPTKTYEFLVSVLGLEKNIKDMEKIGLDIVSSNDQMRLLNQQIDLDKSSLLDLERILSEKKKPEQTHSDQEIERLNFGILAMRANLGSLKQTLAEMIEEIPKPDKKEPDLQPFNDKLLELVPQRAEIKSLVDKINESKSQLKSELSKIPLYLNDAQREGKEIKALTDRIAHAEDAKCPTCLQGWTGEAAIAHIQSMKDEKAQRIQKVLELKAKIDCQTDLEAKIARIDQIIAEKQVELANIEEKHSAINNEKLEHISLVSNANAEKIKAYDDKVRDVKEKIQKGLDEVNSNLKTAEVQLAGQESQKNAYLTSLASYEKEINQLQQVIDKKRANLKLAETTLASLQKRVIMATESKRLIKTFVLQTFQETLDSIGETASNILSAIPNMNTATIYFEGCKETKTGSIKDEITAIINVDGLNDVPIKSLSGGERTAIDLAVDLAVIDVIEQKVAKGANFFFMDEPFDGLDSVCKENCLEILKTVDTNKKIIMVDHSSELKEMVSDVIMVVKDGETSSIMG